MFESSLLPVAAGFIVTVVFMIALRPLATALGIVDRPGGRKTHVGDIPIVGGVAMFIGLYVGFAMVPGFGAPFQNLALSCGILALLGILDDCFELPALPRIVAHILVVLIMSYGDGLIIRDIGNTFGLGIVSFGSLSWLFTMLVTVSVINAYNLVDGADGLAGSLAVIALIGVAIVASPGTLPMSVALVGIAVVAAFLIFNFPLGLNAGVRSFMGDGGSTMLGMVIAWVTISVSQGEARIITPVAALWFASIPVYDLFTQLVRRTLQGKSPFAPDRMHFHHILKDCGLGVRSTVAVMTGLQAIYAAIGLAGHFAALPDAWMFAAWAALGIAQLRLIRLLAAILGTGAIAGRPPLAD